MADVMIIDGGMGKELRRIGAPFRQPEWSALALLDAPELVRKAHQNFVDAGAEVLTTNAYAVVPFHLGQDRFVERGFELATLAARIAREVADAAARPILVAGSLPPLFGSYRPDDFRPDEAGPLWATLIEAQAPYVDVWLAETISSLAEFQHVSEALAASNTEVPMWASFALADELVGGSAKLHSGESIDAVAAASAGCEAVLFNCSQPEIVSKAIPELVNMLGTASTGEGVDGPRVGAYANAFPPAKVGDAAYASNEVIIERREDLTPERYADFAATWIDEGASIVGGCCDIYSQHIAHLFERFGS